MGQQTIHRYEVSPQRTVRHLLPDSPEFQTFPEVFATGFLVGLMEWTCTLALAPYLEDGEGSVGTHICISHSAPTPPGLTVTVTATLSSVDGRRMAWDLVAHDGVDEIGRGEHQRAVIDVARFSARAAAKGITG
jgi:fluoroacetyl-CoA thioesterase